MSNPLYDFVHGPEYPGGLGIFKEDELAKEVASTISKNQKRRFDRCHAVPAAFYIYLRRAKIIRQDEPIPGEEKRTTVQLLGFLRWYPFKNENDRFTAQYICDEILKAEHPELKKSFASIDDLWEELQLGKGRRWR
jgi:hypothetical protein